MFHFQELDWWLFVYSPCVFFSLAFIFGWKRWAVSDKISNFFPILVLIGIRFPNSLFGIFSGDFLFFFLANLFACAWILIVNLKSPGLILFSVGGMINSIVAILNGGKMPALGDTVVSAFYQPMVPETKLWILCDWIITPSGLYVLSIGDLLIAIAGAIFFMNEFKFYLIHKDIIK